MTYGDIGANTNLVPGPAESDSTSIEIARSEASWRVEMGSVDLPPAPAVRSELQMLRD